MGGGPNGQIASLKRTADGNRERNRNITDEKREKCGAKNGSLHNASTELKEATFVILKNHTSAYQKEKIESNEQSKEGGQQK